MSSINSARFEGGSMVIIDNESAALSPEAGWTLGYADINRQGSLVAVHVEVDFVADADEAVTTLPPTYAPLAQLVDPTGKFHLTAAGELLFLGSTAAPGSAVAQFVYTAGVVSPD